MSLISVGTMAFDAIETPFGKTDKIIGGSATYVAWSASHFYKPVKQVSIIGGDFPAEEITALEARGVDFEGVEVVKEGKSFFWSGKYHLDMNSRDTLITDLNVLEQFNPQLPASYRDGAYLMLGNLVPAIQQDVIRQMQSRPKLIVLDTMNFWMDTALDDLKATLKLIDVLVINDSEARQLSGAYAVVQAARIIMDMGPKTLIIKKGEHGALLFSENRIFSAPALPLDRVFDPTGAGDSFAGGFIGYLASTGDLSFDNMKTAVIAGSAMASFCVEKFGPERLKEISPEDVSARIRQFAELVTFEASALA